MKTDDTGARRDKTAALHAAAAVVPVVNPPRFRIVPLEVSTARPCLTCSRAVLSAHTLTHSSGYAKPVTGSCIVIVLSPVFKVHRDYFV